MSDFTGNLEGDFVGLDTSAHSLHCPYCGEKIEIVVDASVTSQEYVEDCFVCCRPINLTVVASADGVDITARHENE